MVQARLFCIGIPLLVIAIPALITTICHRADRSMHPIQMFFVWLVAYSMLAAACGMVATILVDGHYGTIPGTASDGGKIGDRYYFNWHNETYTQVPKETWERAWFLEHLSQHLLLVPFGVFGTSLATLYFTRRFFQNRSTPPESVDTGSGIDSDR